MENIIMSTASMPLVSFVCKRTKQNEFKKCKTKCENKISTEKFVFNRKTKTIETHTRTHSHLFSENFRMVNVSEH